MLASFNIIVCQDNFPYYLENTKKVFVKDYTFNKYQKIKYESSGINLDINYGKNVLFFICGYFKNVGLISNLWNMILKIK